jgi:ADP-ribosyl-[dinitrogen reductase] hydrolase
MHPVQRPFKVTPPLLDRAAGAVVGGAVGDALGAGYEFISPPPSPDQVTMRTGRLTGRPAGSWTDDTDMALAVAQVAAGGFRLDQPAGSDAVGDRFLDWYRGHPPDIGIQTRSVLSRASSGTELANLAAGYARTHERAAGNGSLMRTGPVALGHLGDDMGIVTAADRISALTHADPLAREACVLWSIAIDRAIRESRLDGIFDGIDLLPEDRREFWVRTLKEAEAAPPASLRPNGFVVTALQAAWSAVTSTSDSPASAHLQAGLRAAVAIGDDTDTVAAIAGSLLGARYGASSVPFAWRRRLAGWPSGIGHADLVGLAVRAVNNGKDDPIGWPSAEDLMPYYAANWSPTGRVASLPEDPGVMWGDMAGLATVESDVFISLCRIGRNQRRGSDHYEVWLMDSESPQDNIDLGFVLADSADAVAQLRSEGHRVFVHCVRAESRTPAVATTWLTRHHGLSVVDAKERVRSVMPQARFGLIG